MTIAFRNNNLSGKSQANPYYLSSKTRVCVTVGMMTTGYDCSDLLNICMMRPIFSPSEFIQMKGRGTRKFDFSQNWIDRSKIPSEVGPAKKQFVLFDFFGNYEYFEKDFDYDQVITLPTGQSRNSGDVLDTPDIDFAVSSIPDPLSELKEIIIGDAGMKVDHSFYTSFKQKLRANATLQEMVSKHDLASAEAYLREHILGKPKEYYTVEKLGSSLRLDRLPTIPELLLHSFGHIRYIPSRRELLDKHFDKLDQVLSPSDTFYRRAKEVFEAYVADESFREIIDSKKFAELSTHSSGESFKKLPTELREAIPAYINKNLKLEEFENVR